MTSEEAKELLTHVLMTYEPRDQYGDWDDSEPYEEAITMAIEALSAEPPYQYSEAYVTQLRGERDILQDMVDNMAKPKTGRWVRKEKEINDCDGHRAYYWYECDNCGARPPKDQWGHEWHSDFCPKCGAKMEVEE